MTIRSVFDQELQRIQDDVLLLGSMVESALVESVEILKRRDTEASRHLIAQDRYINEKRFAIEADALALIATQQPVAGDVRTLAAVLEIVTELERMADHASGIAELAIRLADQPHLKPLIDVPRMAKINQEMIRASLDAYLRRDPALALETAKRDAEIDGLYDQVYRELLTYMLSDPKTISRATHLLWVTQWEVLERGRVGRSKCVNVWLTSRRLTFSCGLSGSRSSL